MPTKKIKWTKKYHEDLGTKDKDGFYSYAYCYYIYEFFLPDNDIIKFRQYTDTADKCSMFFPLDELIQKTDSVSKEKVNSISAIINFMRTDSGIEKFEFFNGGYKPVDLDRLVNRFTEFSFEQTETK